MTAADECETLDHIWAQARNEKTVEPYTWAQLLERMVWRNVLYASFFHLLFIASLVFYAFGNYSEPLKWQTVVWMSVVGYGTGLGGTAGAHRLWSHRTYKTNLPVRIILMLAYSVMGLNRLFNWIKDHRCHHKFSDTDADPHNANRGFFFSHIGWQMMTRHPECVRQGRKIDMSDIQADPVVMFQKKYETLLKVIFCFVIPTAVPVIFWGETILHSTLTCVIRYVIIIHCVFTTTSIAHCWGYKPYNRGINPVENLFVSLVSTGEGSHNYHHTFPWDYKASEHPYLNFNLATLFIDGIAKLGWAWDRRTASPELIEKVIRRVGYKSNCKVDEVH